MADTIITLVKPTFDEMVNWLKNAGQHWDEIKDKLKKFKDEVMANSAVKLILSELKQAFDNIWTVVKNNLLPALKDFWKTVKEQLYPAIKDLWEALKPLEPYLKILATVVGAVLIVVLLILVKTIEVIIIAVTEMLVWYVKLETWITKNGSPIVAAFAKAVHGIADAFMDVVNWVEQAIGKIGAFVEKVSKVNLNPFSSGFNIPFLGGRAGGGSVSPSRSFIVGENGPELFTPDSYGQITSNSKLGGGGGVTVNVYGDVSGQELIDKVSRGIMSQLKMNAQI